MSRDAVSSGTLCRRRRCVAERARRGLHGTYSTGRVAGVVDGRGRAADVNASDLAYRRR